MDGSSPVFPDEFLAIAIPLHIIFGGIGAFILCPVAFFIEKHTKWHGIIGRLFLIDVVFIVISGTLLLIDPLFVSVYWADESNLKGFSSLFHSAHYSEVFFLFLAVITLYLSFSAARIWKRINYGRAEIIHTNLFDWLLSVSMLLLCVFFIYVGILDLIHVDKAGWKFIAASMLMLTFVAFDLYTFIKKPKVADHRWWIWHVVKITCAWAGLLDAFWLRIEPILVEKGLIEDLSLPFGTICWVILISLGYFLNHRKMGRSSPQQL